MEHAFSEANGVADQLARLARTQSQDFLLFELPPVEVVVAPKLMYDIIGCSQSRSIGTDGTSPLMYGFG